MTLAILRRIPLYGRNRGMGNMRTRQGIVQQRNADQRGDAEKNQMRVCKHVKPPGKMTRTGYDAGINAPYGKNPAF